MAAGIKYDMAVAIVGEELCDVASIYRLSGGFNLVTTNLVAGTNLPPLAPLAINFATRKATPVINVKIVKSEDSGSTSFRIAKGSLAYVGMHIGTGSKGGTISAIDKTNAEYDTITTAAAVDAKVTVGQVLFEATAVAGTTPKNLANALNYAQTKIEDGATVTGIGSVYEIKESKLHVPVSSGDKTNLGARFMFV